MGQTNDKESVSGELNQSIDQSNNNSADSISDDKASDHCDDIAKVDTTDEKWITIDLW